MHVRVVLLRHQGRKLTAEQLKNVEEHVGHLRIDPGRATLMARTDGPIMVLPALSEAQIRHMRGDEFVVSGEEVVPGGNFGERWTQAWWCRLERS